jgi:hypothetical protein
MPITPVVAAAEAGMSDDSTIALTEHDPADQVSFLRKAIQMSWDETVERARIFGATIDEIQRPWQWMWAPSEDAETYERAPSRDDALIAAFDENPDVLSECFICEARACKVQMHHASYSYFECVADNLIDEMEGNVEVFAEDGQFDPTEAERKQLVGMLRECVEIWLLSRCFSGWYIGEQRNAETVTAD